MSTILFEKVLKSAPKGEPAYIAFFFLFPKGERKKKRGKEREKVAESRFFPTKGRMWEVATGAVSNLTFDEAGGLGNPRFVLMVDALAQ